jgi:hypothetical protein
MYIHMVISTRVSISAIGINESARQHLENKCETAAVCGSRLSFFLNGIVLYQHVIYYKAMNKDIELRAARET